MVRRSSDEPRGIAEQARAQRARVGELARAQGRGTTALRDAAGNVLVMNPAAPHPLLTPQGIDAAVAFTADGTVKMTSPDTLSDRDMTVRDIASSGTVKANNFSATGSVHATGPITSDSSFTANGPAAFYGTVTTGQINMGFSPLYTGFINCQGLHAVGNITATGTIIGAPSERRFKTDITPAAETLGRSLCDVIAGAPVSSWRYRSDCPEVSDIANGQNRIGPMVDDLPDAAVADIDGRKHPDMYSMLSIAWGALGEAYAQINTLTGQVAALTGRLDRLEAQQAT